MAVTVVQVKASANGTSISSAGTNFAFNSAVTSGNAVIAVVAIGAAQASFAVSDATNGTYDTTVLFSSGSAAVVRSKRNVTGGFTTVTFTPATTGNGTMVLFEVSGLDNSAAPQTGTKNNSPSTTSHVCSSGTITGNGFAVGAAQAGANNNWTPGTGYTNASTTTSNSRVIQYLTGAVSDAGPFTEGASTTSPACMAVFAASGVRLLALLGCG